MKVTKTLEIKFPWQLENDGHGWTTIYELPDGTYKYVNKFSNHKICEEREMTKKEMQKLIDSCYEIARVTEY